MKSYINENIDFMISCLGELISISSIYSKESKELAPFGKQIRSSLDYILKLGESLGFSVKDYNGYAAEITAGQGSNIIGVLCHIDVVSAGNGWNTDPFKMTRIENKLYGRGTLDDKGPLISSLFSIKYLLDNNLIPDDFCIKLIIGADEEESWKCIQYYKQHADTLPKVSIVPDGNFPLIHCEKGLIDFNLSYTSILKKDTDIQLVSLEGGNGRNIVADSATCILKCNSPEELIKSLKLSDGVKAKITKGMVQLTASGRSAHAMTPEKGDNAIAKLLYDLLQLEQRFSHEKFIRLYNQYIGSDYKATKFGCAMSDEISGFLTFNVGKIGFDSQTGLITMECNVRYPSSCKNVEEMLKEKLNQVGFMYQYVDSLEPIYFDEENPFIKLLLSAYRKVTDDQKSKPFAIGGATYARALPNAVAFGPLFPYEEELAHEPNEFLTVESLKKMTEIYILALENLMNSHLEDIFKFSFDNI